MLDNLIKLFPPLWQPYLKVANCLEIRVRTGKPVQIITTEGEITTGLIATEADISHLISAVSSGSLYAYEEEIKQGYITLSGGHRVGFGGRIIYAAGEIRGMKYITSLCFRVAHSVLGCGKSVLPSLVQRGKLLSTLIISPPQGGKTTLLRDLTRLVSEGVAEIKLSPQRVTVVDERSEIAGCYRGVPTLDVGMRTDVLDATPKSSGVLMALRALSPQVIVTDEVGTAADVVALEEVINAGVSILATAHGSNYEDVLKRPALTTFLRSDVFARIIVLSGKRGPGTVEYVGPPPTRVGGRGETVASGR